MSLSSEVTLLISLLNTALYNANNDSMIENANSKQIILNLAQSMSDAIYTYITKAEVVTTCIARENQTDSPCMGNTLTQRTGSGSGNVV